MKYERFSDEYEYNTEKVASDKYSITIRNIYEEYNRYVLIEGSENLQERIKEEIEKFDEYIDKCRILIATRFSGMTTGTFGLQKAKDENGNRYYYCDLSEYFYGQPRRITAKTLFEMEARLEILKEKHNFSADYVLDIPGFPYFYNGTLKNKIDEMQLPEQMKTVFWANFDMLIAGSPKEREQARKVICDFLHVREVFERTEIIEKGRLFIENMEKAEENNESAVFHDYLHQAIDVECMFSGNKLARIVGCTPAAISRIRSGEITPKKDLVIKLGIALELSGEDLRRFIHSAGYVFPTTPKDVIINDCVANGITDIDIIRDKLYEYDPNIDL